MPEPRHNQRLWDQISLAHEALDVAVEETRVRVREVHVLLQEALDCFERGDTVASHLAIKRAMDQEFEIFGDCSAAGDDELLSALGYPEDDDELDALEALAGTARA